MTDLDRAYRGCLTVPSADSLARENAGRARELAQRYRQSGMESPPPPDVETSAELL
jgi:hypothetical protein